MTNRVAELARRTKVEQAKPWNEEKETDEQHLARLALEDDWIGGVCYKGNSISWSHSKSVRYRNDLQKAWDALAEIGVYPDGKTHIADAIRRIKVVEPIKS